MKRTTTSRRKRWFFARAMARAYREMLEKRRRKRPGSKNAKAATQRPLFAEALEPRVLFSGTPAPAETDTEAEDQNQEALRCFMKARPPCSPNEIQDPQSTHRPLV